MMTALPPSLPPETPIFRIVDFFSAATLISTKKLRIPCANNFSDDNEGVDRLLASYEATSGPCAGALSGFKGRDRVLVAHEKIKSSHFVSCWTLTRESVAMWSLYSKDYIGVRLQTTVGQLEKALNHFQEVYGLMSFLSSETHKPTQVVTSSMISSVRYEDLHRLHSKISRRSRAWHKLKEQGKIAPINLQRIRTPREIKRVGEYRFEPFTLKDITYLHENELRAIIRLADARAVNLPLGWRDEYNKETDEGKYNLLLGTADLLNFSQEEKGILDLDAIYVDIPHDFITTVTLDPRCIPHMRNFALNWFKSHNVKITSSHCFGKFTDIIDLTEPIWNTASTKI